MTPQKPVIGISCGDLNGIGIELIIKTFADHRILEHCTPVIFCSNKAINFYRKSVPEINLNYQNIKEWYRKGYSVLATMYLSNMKIVNFIVLILVFLN